MVPGVKTLPFTSACHRVGHLPPEKVAPRSCAKTERIRRPKPNRNSAAVLSFVQGHRFLMVASVLAAAAGYVDSRSATG
jgi:hypothetical protein